MANEIDVEPIKEQLAKVEADLKSPLPTPPVGTPVVWYPRAQVGADNQIAALVTKVEGPGKVTLTAFRPQGTADPTRRGCLHVSHPVHEQRANAVSVNAGAWDYIEGWDVPGEHYELHRGVLEIKRDSLSDQIAVATDMKKQQAGKAAATKKQAESASA